ncbi:glycosyl hydrolase, partial [Akkermansiaceae bacterium]|nr:glycosyl hydrolase [Akkermansiaceae bacterium]
LTAEILRLLGFNMNLCPVLDISYDDEADNSLKGRCYGSDAQEVINNAGVFNRNMRHYNIMSCGKHFPSCGLADKDPHHDLPYVDKSVEDMLKSDLLPYTALMSELNALMTCHTHFSAIDPDSPGLPGSMSHNLITGLLRNQLGYEGLIMTDDLDMGAILNTYGRGPDVKNSIMAGNDMAMICHQIDTAGIALKHLEELPIGNVDDSLKRIHKLKKGFKKTWPYTDKLWKDINADIMKLRVDVLGEERAHEVIDYTGETRSPVEDY